MQRLIAAFVFIVGYNASAFAERFPQVNNDGYAFSRRLDDSKGKKGKVEVYDPVAAYEDNVRRLSDCQRFHVDSYQEVNWCFADAKNLALFKRAMKASRNPYVPYLGGFCMGSAAHYGPNDPGGQDWIADGDPVNFARIALGPDGSDEVLLVWGSARGEQKWTRRTPDILAALPLAEEHVRQYLATLTPKQASK